MKKLIVPFALLLGTAGPASVSAQKGKQSNSTISKTEVKFLEEISVPLDPEAETGKTLPAVGSQPVMAPSGPLAVNDFQMENASSLQLKYAIMLNTEVEQIKNTRLFQGIDDWYGTRYRLGGNSKEGVDCSGLVCALYASCYGMTLPRTSREQYDFTQHIPSSDLTEGDLVFFNTLGGVSHVGIYLQNNKFVHASNSGVMISDLNESYWTKRFIGAGRVPANPAGTDTLASVSAN